MIQIEKKNQMNQIDQFMSQKKNVSSFCKNALVLISLYHDIISHVANAHVTHNREHTTYNIVVY